MGEAPAALRTGWVLGIDEAGRGPVLGPLVVGGFLLRTDRLPDLARLGVRDSKKLSPARRSAIFERLPEIGERHHIVLAPSEIDRAVRVGGLNDLEARSFARLVRRTRPQTAFVDACDTDAARFGRRVRGYAKVPSEVVARHKADRDLLVVGAASIVAKVLRDRALERLRVAVGAELGSGYPGDARTRAFLSDVLRRGERPEYVRHEWRTTKELMPRRGPTPLEAFQ